MSIRSPIRLDCAHLAAQTAPTASTTTRTAPSTDGAFLRKGARYILSDHLGSTSTIVDRNGATATVRYWPYGATRSTSGTVGTDKLFTGQQIEPDDPALGLYNYKARFYSTTLGRFVSADVIANDGMNRFTYAANNPLRYADPTGHCVKDANGKWLECTRKTMIQVFSCAWGGRCDAGGSTDAVRRYAKAVIGSDTFKFFVGVESAERGDIRLRLELSMTVKGAGRKIPSYPHDDKVGNFRLFVDVNATRRTVISGYGWFRRSDGMGGYLDGWSVQDQRFRNTERGANLRIDAGPQGQPIFKNPFAATEFRARVAWDLWFEPDGNLSQEIAFSQEGDFGIVPIGNDIPVVDDLLVSAGLSLTVTEVPELLW